MLTAAMTLIVASGTSLQILYPLPGGAFTVSSALPDSTVPIPSLSDPVDGKSNSRPRHCHFIGKSAAYRRNHQPVLVLSP